MNCIGSGTDEEFARLVEIVVRRNLQLHKRGIVDERYLETDPITNKAKYNLYKLKRGDLAIIDERYWTLAKELCGQCVRQVTMWANR